MTPLRTIDEVCEALNSIDQSSLRWQVKKAHAIKEWALRQLGIEYVVGDQVQIVWQVPTQNGWHAYREALAEGATGTVVDIDFNPYSDEGRGAWHVDVALDRAWQVVESGGEVKRYWKGRADKTPDGYEPPSKFDQETYPNGKTKIFSLRVEWVKLHRRRYVELNGRMANR